MKTKRRLLMLVISLSTLLLILSFVSCLSFDNTGKPKKIQCITIEDSYAVWNPTTMKSLIQTKASNKYDSSDVTCLLNRDYDSMYVEWWAHNIGYCVTKPFCFIEEINRINLRCKDVDLEKFI